MRKSALLAAALATLAVACAREPADDQRTDQIRAEDVRQARAGISPELRDQLDNGNAAFQQGHYELALRHYEEATRLNPDHAAGWFGVYMAQYALGDLAAAESAIRRANELAPNPSLIEPGPNP
jgi:tetratricopeptide (TPR) repeat protein